MNANELRIGNIVLDLFNKTPEQCIITCEDFAVIDNYMKSSHRIPYKGINLDESWLLMSGFKKTKGVFELKLRNYLFIRGHFTNKGFNIVIDEYHHHDDRESVSLLSLNYVHELQNLVFGLQREELIIKI